MIEEYYKDRENCCGDLSIARSLMTSGTATEEQLDGMEKGLALMYCYCPEDMMEMVHSQLEESERRRMYRRLHK
jgi:hypothetical protein